MSIEVKNVSVSFKDKNASISAVNDFSCRIAENEFIAIVGRSGCGKSTLLNVIAGYIVPNIGSVSLNESNLGEGERSSILIFQEDSVFPWMTVAENITYGLRIKKNSYEEIDAVLNKYLESTGLTKFRDFFPKDLSGGLKKRVDLARAYAIDTNIILMDEPFGSLDSHTRQQMQELLLQLWNSKKKTIVFVTHDIEEAILLADKIIVMDKGSLIQTYISAFERPRVNQMKYNEAFISLRRNIESKMTNEN